jgi:hypothetical protein
MFGRVVVHSLLHLEETQGNKLEFFVGGAGVDRHDEAEGEELGLSGGRVFGCAATGGGDGFRGQDGVGEEWIVDAVSKGGDGVVELGAEDLVFEIERAGRGACFEEFEEGGDGHAVQLGEVVEVPSLETFER